MTDKNTRMAVHAGPAEAPISDEMFMPLADIYETQDGATYVVVELPGARQDQVDIKVDKGVLTIQAQADLPDVGPNFTATYSGFVGGSYFRAFALSDEIDRDRIEANFSDGLLTLKLPRAAAAQTRKIEIKSE